MRIADVATGEEIDAAIIPMEMRDFGTIRKRDSGFGRFNWNKYKEKQVFKCIEVRTRNILGVMCITDHADPGTNAVEIDLLEIRDADIGSDKLIDGVAGCLIAFACRESFKNGHDGFVFLTPKTELIDHYRQKYGMEYVPPIGKNLAGFMVISEPISRKLIKFYLS